MPNSPLHIKSMTPQYSLSPIRSRASSATLVEIRAGLLLLQWAQNRKISSICIQTDCLVFVQGLLNSDRASSSHNLAFCDFLYLCSFFDAVKVVKVSR